MGRDPGRRLARLDADPLWAQLVGWSMTDDFRHQLFGPSEVWDSVPPFVAHRHLKWQRRDRHTPHFVGPVPLSAFIELRVRELAGHRLDVDAPDVGRAEFIELRVRELAGGRGGVGQILAVDPLSRVTGCGQPSIDGRGTAMTLTAGAPDGLFRIRFGVVCRR